MDLDRVMEIAAEDSQAPRWTRGTYVAALDPESAPRRVGLVAENAEQNTIAGFAVVSVLPPDAELETIVTVKAFRRCGVAKRLFAELVGELKRLGVLNILLEVRESNWPALALYAGQGFEEFGRRKAYYADPIEDAVHMRLTIP
jgi:ribosomal-protein-alanine N-acetyltransferase